MVARFLLLEVPALFISRFHILSRHDVRGNMAVHIRLCHQPFIGVLFIYQARSLVLDLWPAMFLLSPLLFLDNPFHAPIGFFHFILSLALGVQSPSHPCRTAGPSCRCSQTLSQLLAFLGPLPSPLSLDLFQVRSGFFCFSWDGPMRVIEIL